MDTRYQKYKNKYLLLEKSYNSFKMSGGDYQSADVLKFVNATLVPFSENYDSVIVDRLRTDKEIEKLYDGIIATAKKFPLQKSTSFTELIEQLRSADKEFTRDFNTFNADIISKLNESSEGKKAATKLTSAIFKLQNSMYHLQVRVILYKCSELQKAIIEEADPELSQQVAKLFLLLNNKIKVFNKVMDEKAKICQSPIQ